MITKSRTTDIRGSALLLAIAIAVVVPDLLSAQQAATGASGQWVAPRTEHGHPDLQGDWSNATLTSLERRPGMPPTLTAEQVAEIEGGVAAFLEEGAQPSDPDRPAPQAGGGDFSTTQSVLTGSFNAASGGTGGYNTVYIEPGERVAVVNGEARSSLVTFPENGRVPAVTPAAQQWRAEQMAFRRQFGQFDHPELLSIGDRCILSFGSNAGPPMLPNGFYNNNYTIVQNADHVLIMTEMVNDIRVIRLGDGPRLPSHIRPYMGDSWGRWDGETLVVETTNFHPRQTIQNTPSDDLRVVERFTRVSPDKILYEFDVHNPSVFTESWGGQVPMNRLDGRIYEYACHEGNYSMQNILSGARFQEEQDRETQPASR
jgi:hypothetical protein